MSTSQLSKWIAGISMGLTLCGAAGCKEKPAPVTPPPAVEVVEQPSAEEAARIAEANLRSLDQQLAYESSHRPADTVSADQLFDALGKQGITIGQRQQSLGRTHQAAYCVNGRSEQGLYLLICEYDESKRLTSGKTVTAKVFATMPSPSQHVRKKTVLNVVRQAGTASAQADTAVRLFETL